MHVGRARELSTVWDHRAVEVALTSTGSLFPYELDSTLDAGDIRAMKRILVGISFVSMVAVSIGCGSDSTGSNGADGGVGVDGSNATRCIAQGGGLLRVALTGAISETIDWANDGTGCAGTQLVAGWSSIFTRDGTDGAQLDVKFDITQGMEGSTGTAIPGRVSVTKEGVPSPFSTPTDSCSYNVTVHALVESTAVGDLYRVTATGSCSMPATPLFPSVSGSVTIGNFEYTGVTVW